MSGRKPHWLVRLYPAAWRERYGDELEELLADEGGPRVTFDIVRAAAVEWILDLTGMGVRQMQTYRSSVIAMAKHPSAWGPLALSGGALLLLAGAFTYNLVTGAVVQKDQDEGVLAHLYQIMIGVQVLIIPIFGLRWGWRDWRAGSTLIALQVLGILLTFVPLWIYEHNL
jgi:hypothetical protein